MEKTDLKMPNLLVPDALSGLIQLNSRRLGVCLKWSGKGLEDLHKLILFASNTDHTAKGLWSGVQELWAMPELKELPEPVYAKICSIILAARAKTELSLMKRNAKAAAGNPQPVPTDAGPERPL